MANTWNQAVSAALNDADGWSIDLASQPVTSIAAFRRGEPPGRYEYLARLVHDGNAIPAYQWIGEISRRHPDKMKALDYRIIEMAIADMSGSDIEADINLSAAILSDKQFPMWFSQRVIEVGSQRIRLDIDMRVKLTDEQKRTLNQLWDVFRVTLDDFGDRASLKDFRELRPDGIKVASGVIAGICEDSVSMHLAQTCKHLAIECTEQIVFKGVGDEATLESIAEACGDDVLVQGRVVAG